jgi:glycine C-acetyltransferase
VIPRSLLQVARKIDSQASETPLSAAHPGHVRIDRHTMVNMASNDYLGFARDPRVLKAAHAALDEWGVGSASGRVLSGTTPLHVELEDRLARWVGCQTAVLQPSCWIANASILQVLANLADRVSTTLAVFSDRLNHASIIDAIRAQRPTLSHLGLYEHRNLEHLRSDLGKRPPQEIRVIITDGVFSMEGDIAPLKELDDLATRFGALLIVDDSHGTGVAGPTGRGSAEATGVAGRVDIITGTLGKALGGGIGGFIAGPEELMGTVRALSRPYIFSNNPPPSVVAAALAALEILESDPQPLNTLRQRVAHLRTGIDALELRTYPGDHPIVPVILGAETPTQNASQQLATFGVYAKALTFPIVPRGQARLRLQVSAAHTTEAIQHVLHALEASGLGTGTIR